MTTVKIDTGTYVKRYDFWNPATWTIPKLYWDAFSQEQRIHAICRQLEKVIRYADYVGVNVDDIAERLQDIEDGKLDEFITTAIETWFEENNVSEILTNLSFNNPCVYGADPTGIEYSDEAFAACIADNLGKQISVTPGCYRFKNTLLLPGIPAHRVNIDFGGSILNFETDCNSACIIVGNDLEQNYSANMRHTVVTNFILVNNEVNEGEGTAIYFADYSKTFRFENFAIIGEFACGVRIGSGSGEQIPGDIYLDNFSINLVNSYYDNVGIGIYNTDCKINNGFISGVRNAIVSDANAIYMDNVHAIAQGDNLTNIDSSYLLLTGRTYTDENNNAKTYNGNHFYLTNCYCDTMKHFVKTARSYVLTLVFVDCKFYSYLAMNQLVFDMPNVNDWNFTIIGGQITLSSDANNQITNANTNANSEYNVNNRTTIKGLTYISGEVKTLADPFIATKNRVHPYKSDLTIVADTWYKIAVIGNARYQQIPLRIALGGVRYWEGFITSNSGYTTSSIVKTGGSGSGQIVTIGLKPITNGFELYVKSQDNSTSLVCVSSVYECLYPLQLTGRTLSELVEDTPTIIES